MLKILHVLRLLHMAKHMSSRITGVWRIVRLFGAILLVSHWVTCGWFNLVSSEPEREWIRLNDLEDADASTMYFTAAYSAVLAMSGESIDPQTNSEDRSEHVTLTYFSQNCVKKYTQFANRVTNLGPIRLGNPRFLARNFDFIGNFVTLRLFYSSLGDLFSRTEFP